MRMQYYFVLIPFLILCFIFSTLDPANGQEKKPPPEKNYVAHEILLRFYPWVDESEKQAVRDALEAVKVKTIKSIQVEYWRLPDDITTDEAIEYLNNLSEIKYVEPNYLDKLQTLPNDPQFNKLWFLKNTGQSVNGLSGKAGADISAPSAWDIETGNSQIIIAVVDSGVAFDHPDLRNNVWTNTAEIPDNNIDDDNNGYVDDIHGWDFAYGDNNPSDYSRGLQGDGHGTLVAGIIAAEGNNGIGISGVMWHARLMPLRVKPLFGAIATANFINAVDYAVNNGARIINYSAGGFLYSQSEYEILEYANQHGVLVVVSALNSSNDNDTSPCYPSSYDLPNIISVAATNESDELATYSNYGLHSVDVAAPGGGVKSNMYSTTPPERVTLFYDDFESGGDKWYTSGIYEPWSIGYTSIFNSNVIRDSVLWYHENEFSYLRMIHPVDATNCRGLVLLFDIAYELEEDFDYCFLEASRDGFNWDDVLYVTGYSNGIIPYIGWYSELDLGQFYLGFRLESDYLYNYQGVSIDNIIISAIPWVFNGDEYDYQRGTSMAAPVVSGLAGLIWSLNPYLSHQRVKNIILNTVDKVSSLNDKVLSGGRINAYKALQSVINGDILPSFLQNFFRF